MNQIAALKPVVWPLRAFLCFPMFLYPRHSSRYIKPPEPPKGHCTICTTGTGLYYTIYTNSNFSGYFHFLQIWLDDSNFYVFPSCFAQIKWKIDGSSAHKHERTLQFLHFFQLYTVHIMAGREKIDRIFSCVCARIKLCRFFPSNMCLHIITTARLFWLMTDFCAEPSMYMPLRRTRQDDVQVAWYGWL